MTEEQTESFEDSDYDDERTIFVDQRINLFGAQLSSGVNDIKGFTPLFMRCHASSTKEHDYSYFILSTPDRGDDAGPDGDPLISVKFTPAVPDCMGQIAVTLVDKLDNKSFAQLGKTHVPFNLLVSLKKVAP